MCIRDSHVFLVLYHVGLTAVFVKIIRIGPKREKNTLWRPPLENYPWLGKKAGRPMLLLAGVFFCTKTWALDPTEGSYGIKWNEMECKRSSDHIFLVGYRHIWIINCIVSFEYWLKNIDISLLALHTSTYLTLERHQQRPCQFLQFLYYAISFY